MIWAPTSNRHWRTLGTVVAQSLSGPLGRVLQRLDEVYANMRPPQPWRTLAAVSLVSKCVVLRSGWHLSSYTQIGTFRTLFKDSNTLSNPVSIVAKSRSNPSKSYKSRPCFHGWTGRSHPQHCQQCLSASYGHSFCAPAIPHFPLRSPRYEATRDLTTKSISVKTGAVDDCPAKKIAESVAVVPILRSATF